MNKKYAGRRTVYWRRAGLSLVLTTGLVLQGGLPINTALAAAGTSYGEAAASGTANAQLYASTTSLADDSQNQASTGGLAPDDVDGGIPPVEDPSSPDGGQDPTGGEPTPTAPGPVQLPPAGEVPATAAEAAAIADNLNQQLSKSLKLVSEEPIASGAMLQKYEWSTTRSGKTATTKANVIMVDLQNPYVKLDVLTTDNKITGKDTVNNLVKNSGAVAGVNGSFFNVNLNTTPPLGHEIQNSQWLTTTIPSAGWQTFAVTKDNVPVIDFFTFKGTVTNDQGASFPLSGLNKSGQWINGVHSHLDKMYVYTPVWGSLSRGNDGGTWPTEVLVQNGVITQISGKELDVKSVPQDGYILRANGKAAKYVTDNLKVGQQITLDYEMVPSDPSIHIDTKDYKMMIGGQTLLVKDGKPAAFTADVTDIGGYRSRTAVGYSRDGRYVYIVTGERNSGSDGFSLSELQQFMVSIGIWRGMNLDGGGSTQISARPLGEATPVLTNMTEFGGERRVINGLGVFSTAPTGVFGGFKLNGPKIVFLGEKAGFSLKGYDQYFNPMNAGNVNVQYSANKPVTWEGSTFSTNQPGTLTVTAAVNGVASQSASVEVVGREQIKEMQLNSSASSVVAGGAFPVSVTIETFSGYKRTVPTSSLKWEMIGMEGSVTDGVLKVDNITAADAVKLIAHYDGYSVMKVFPLGVTKMWADFDNASYPVTLAVSPKEVTGSAQIKAPDAGSGNKAVVINYDFTSGMGTKAAYAVLNGTKGLIMAGSPIAFNVNVKGDNSYNWIGMEMTDGNGKAQRVYITQNVNWTGWKTLKVDLASSKFVYPLTVKRIYVVNPETDQDERALTGSIAVDQISLINPASISSGKRPPMKLVIDSKTFTVAGKTQTIDQPPVILNRRTMVPIKFIIDAVGGQVTWDGPNQKVTIIKDDQLLELWMNKNQVNLNGACTYNDVPPTILGQRTMVPLKVISEQLGWKVTWDGKNRAVLME